MDLARLLVCLRGAAEHGHQPVDLLLGAESVDVFHQRFRMVHVAGVRLDLVCVIEVLDPPPGEHRRHRLDGAEFVPDAFDVSGIEDSCLHRRGICVVRVRVPSAELEIVETGQRDELLDEGVATFVSLAQTYVRHLSQGAGGLGVAPAGGDHTGGEGRCHGSHPGSQDAEFALGGGDGLWCRHDPPVTDDTGAG